MAELYISKNINIDIEEFKKIVKNKTEVQKFCEGKYYYIDTEDCVCLKSSNKRERSDNAKHFSHLKNVPDGILDIIKASAEELK